MSKTWRCCLSFNHPKATSMTFIRLFLRWHIVITLTFFNFSKDHLSSRIKTWKKKGQEDKKVGLPRKNTTRSVIWKASVLESCQYKGLRRPEGKRKASMSVMNLWTLTSSEILTFLPPFIHWSEVKEVKSIIHEYGNSGCIHSRL